MESLKPQEEKFKTFDYFPCHNKYKFVGQDRFVIGKDKDLIGTDGITLCLAITLYDPSRKIGALAHISGFGDVSERLEPEKVIDTLLSELNLSESLDISKLEATLSGEGMVINEERRNSSIVREKLNEYKIPIIGEDLCKAPGRLVFLNCDTGVVEVHRV